MEGVARHKDRFFSHSEFYARAAAGTLPAYSYILPRNDNSDHPCYDIGKGERLLKDIYEALRVSHQRLEPPCLRPQQLSDDRAGAGGSRLEPDPLVGWVRRRRWVLRSRTSPTPPV